MTVLEQFSLFPVEGSRQAAVAQCIKVLGEGTSVTAIDILLDERIPAWARFEACLSREAVPLQSLRRLTCDLARRITPDRPDCMTLSLQSLEECITGTVFPESSLGVVDAAFYVKLADIRDVMRGWWETYAHTSLKLTADIIYVTAGSLTFCALHDVYGAIKENYARQQMLGPDYEVALLDIFLSRLRSDTGLGSREIAARKPTVIGTGLLFTALPRRNYDPCPGR